MAVAGRISRTTKRWIGLMVVGLLLIGAVSVSAQSAGGTFKVGMNAPVKLDPALNSNDPETAFNRALYDFLIDVKPDASLAPDLADSWTVSDDSLTYTFKLHPGVIFHDGSALTSKDVAFSFNRLVTAGSPAVGLLGKFDVSTPDDGTVVFKLPEVNADFLYGVGSRWAFIIKDGQDAPNVLAEGSADPYASFNGTGPFILKEFSPEDHATFVRNDKYWKTGEPKLAELDFVYISDPVAQVDALASGSVDFIFKVPSTQTNRIDGQTGLKMLQRPTAQHAVIRLRTDEGPGKSVEVRQALKYATDRAALNEALTNGLGIVGNNDPIGPVYPQYFDVQIKNQQPDAKMACDLIAKGGFPDGLKLTLFSPDSLGYPDMATLLQSQWQATGCITVDIQVKPEGNYYDTTQPDNYFDVDLGITGWGARPVPQQYLQEAYAGDAPYNETRWNDPELNDLIKQAHSTTDEAARKAIYAKISEIFLDRGPIIIPYFAPIIGGVSDKVQGLDMNPYPGLTDYSTVSVG